MPLTSGLDRSHEMQNYKCDIACLNVPLHDTVLTHRYLHHDPDVNEPQRKQGSSIPLALMEGLHLRVEDSYSERYYDEGAQCRCVQD